MNKTTDTFPFLVSAGFLVLVAAIAVWLSSCNSGSEIPIDVPPPPADVTPDESPEICLDRTEYLELVHRVCVYCKDSVVCEEGDDWTDECDEDVPRGHLHKDCRGDGPLDDDDSDTDDKHASLACDRNCEPNDPICIPCDLELGTRCRTECFDLPLGRECYTVCEETVA